MQDIKRAHPKDKFTHEEDERLRRIVLSSDSIDWTKIADKMGNRNARQCKDRWTKYLNPNINTQEFSIDEDIKLLTLHEQFGSKWVLISKFFNNRSDVSIKSRFQVLRRRGITKQVLHLSQFQSKSQLAMMYLRNETKLSHKTSKRKEKQDTFTSESSASDVPYSPLDISITSSPMDDQFFTNFDQFEISDILF